MPENTPTKKEKEEVMARNGLAHSEPFLWMGKYMQFNGQMVHRTLWESHNGEIPDGCLVHHKNGDRLDNRLENLEVMTLGEHCKLHQPRLGYRAPISTVCKACGGERNKVEIASDPYRHKCNKCRSKDNRERMVCHEPLV